MSRRSELEAPEAAFDEVAERWARSVWDAWAPHRTTIERQVQGLLRRRGSAGR